MCWFILINRYFIRSYIGNHLVENLKHLVLLSQNHFKCCSSSGEQLGFLLIFAFTLFLFIFANSSLLRIQPPAGLLMKRSTHNSHCQFNLLTESFHIKKYQIVHWKTESSLVGGSLASLEEGCEHFSCCSKD